jgi:hypothetical protein
MDPKDHKGDDFIDDTLHDVAEGETARVVDRIAERQLCRKFDVRLMPVLAIMCKIGVARVPSICLTFLVDLFNALDKGNLGNAQTAGLSDSKTFRSTGSVWQQLTSIRSQLPARTVQPLGINLLRPLCCFCSTDRNHWQEVRPC